jgi:general secretion pathway protein I
MKKAPKTMSLTGKSSVPHLPCADDHGPLRRAGNGFTLIEVLIALVILSTGLVLVLRAFQTSVVALGEARDSLWASLLIADKMTELREDVRTGGTLASDRGQFGGRYAVFHWESTVREALDLHEGGIVGAQSGKLFEVTIAVRRERAEREYAATTLMRAPSN